jgi:hypothetical protein
MHIYSRASAKGKRVQVSLHLSVIFFSAFYVVSSIIENNCYCFFLV